MARFTDDQADISEAIRAMLVLYEWVRGLDPAQLDVAQGGMRYTKQLVEMIAKTLHHTIPNFSPCVFVEKYHFFQYGHQGESITLKTGDLAALVEIGEALKTDISHMVGTKPRPIQRAFSIDGTIIKTHRVSSEGVRREQRDKPLAAASGEKLRLKILFGSPLPDEIEKCLSSMSLSPATPPAQYEAFILRTVPGSALGDAIYLEEGNQISCPGFVMPETSFIKVLKFQLVKYQSLFGSFERIKACKHCGRLFVEKRLGSKEFCGGTCRKQYFDSLQVPEVRLCRERQNAWMIRKWNETVGMPKVFRLQRDECEGCAGNHKGGSCPALRAKNAKAFKVLDRL